MPRHELSAPSSRPCRKRLRARRASVIRTHGLGQHGRPMETPPGPARSCAKVPMRSFAHRAFAIRPNFTARADILSLRELRLTRFIAFEPAIAEPCPGVQASYENAKTAVPIRCG